MNQKSWKTQSWIIDIQEGIAPVDGEFDFDAYSIDNIPVWLDKKTDKPEGLPGSVLYHFYTTIY